MKCAKCATMLISEDNLFFFVQSPIDVRLSLKPERKIFVEDCFTTQIDNKNVELVQCKMCSKTVGKLCIDQPLWCFGTEKIFLLERKLTSKDKWREFYNKPPYSTINVRSTPLCNIETNNITYEPIIDNLTSPNLHLVNQIYTLDNLKDDSTNFEHFFWDDLLITNKIPREHQLLGYIQALLNNLIIVLPTGSGKTLIAALVAARMKKLNPELMILFLVERIPLVFQQGQVLKTETHLKICCLCGENNTQHRKMRLKEGYYDVLVVTAGALENLIINQHISLSFFSCIIFDECHHATGNHPYCRILDNLRASFHPSQRIVGLTASPVSVKSDTHKTLVSLKQLRERFFNASFYTYFGDSNLQCHRPNIIINVLPHDAEIQRIIDSTKIEMDSIITKLQDIHPTLELKIYNWEIFSEMARLRGILNTCELWSRGKPNKSEIYKLVKQLLEKCDELEIIKLIGCSTFDSNQVGTSNLPSPRLGALLQLLENTTNDSKIIVFVSTRKAAEVVTSYLEQIPNIKEKFNPLKIVGHCGAFGMAWTDCQENVIREFSRGNCNLLVSTSVLEEGFDVPECDLVIRYDRLTTSLISYVQARGRARKQESKYVLFVNSNEARVLDNILKNEREMETALQQLSNPTQDISRSILGHVNMPQPSNEFPIYPTITGNDCSIELYIETGQISYEIQILKESIADTFDELCNIFVERIEVVSNENMKTMGIFLNTDILVFLNLNSRDIISDYHFLSTTWNFCLTNQDEKTQLVWSRVEFPTLSDFPSKGEWKNVKRLLVGYFENRNKFICHFQQSDILEVEFDPENSLIINCKTHTIEIPLAELYKFAVASWFKDDKVNLFLPLKSVPSITNCSSYLPLVPLMSALSCNPVIGLTMCYDRSNWYKLWRMIHHSKLLPVPLFDTKIEVQGSFNGLFDATAISHPLASDSKVFRDCIWVFSILCSNRSVCLPRVATMTIYNFILSITDHNICRAYTIALYCIVDRLIDINKSAFRDITRLHPFRKKQPLSYWDNIIEQIELYYYLAKNNKLYHNSITESELGWNQCKLECAIITPLRKICLPPIICTSSRLLRKYSQLRFLSVAFRGEQQQKLRDEGYTEIIGSFLNNGFRLHGCQFHFLACSNSQLRDCKALFVTFPSNNAQALIQKIRNSILGETFFKAEAQYMSRLALFCTSDQPTVEISKLNVSTIKDISADNGVLVTDGAGKIDSKVANKVNAVLLEKFKFQRFFEKNISPAAYQIRLAGNKGILVVVDKETDPDFIQLKDRNIDIILRNSMNKFNWTDSTLCIIRTSRFNSVHLNRDVITLLTSLRDETEQWEPEITLKSLLQQELTRLADILIDPQAAVKEIVSNLPSYFKTSSGALNSYFNTVSSQFDVLNEPFLFSLVRLIYTYKTRSLKLKAHIPVYDGALLIGIPDPFGVLQENQVFVRYKRNEDETLTINPVKTLIGPVLVYRNPCMHPGDLLRLNAVDCPLLHDYLNVIIFPIRGSKSLPGSTGGGDLDGDEFSIIWDKRLIPPPHCVYESLNYDRIAEEAKDKYPPGENNTPISTDTPDNIRERLAEFYCRVVMNESIGRVANMHLVVSDILEDGAKDPIAIDLAKSQSVAVDFPKTGILPEVPQDALTLVKKKGYPNFMEKKQVTYTSFKALGELYRMCKSLCYDVFSDKASNLDMLQQITESYSTLMDIKGSHAHLKRARAIYRFYCSEFQRILISFGVQSEEEAILCMVVEWHPLINSRRIEAIATLEVQITELFEKFRLIFQNDLAANNKLEDQLCIASAWYQVAHEAEQDENNMQFLSLPWILGDLLCSIRRRTLNITVTIYEKIGSSAIDYITNQKNYIYDNVKLKMSVYPILQSIIDEKSQGAFKTDIFGSVALYLCDQDSDLDISITPTHLAYSSLDDKFNSYPLSKQHAHFLENFISVYIDDVVSLLDANYTRIIPIICCTVESPSQSDTKVNVDIVVNSDGVHKFNYIQNLYVESGGVVFAWLWILVRWARQCGILKWAAVGNESGILRPAEFHAFALYIFDKMPSHSKTFSRTLCDNTLSHILSYVSIKQNNLILGSLLLKFFTIGSKIALEGNTITYIWPVEGNPTHTIDQSALIRMSELLFHAQQCLTYTRNIHKLFEYNYNPLVYTKNLAPAISFRLEGGMQFHSKRLESLSGASVQIRRIGHLIQVRGEGTPHALQKLGTEVENLSFMSQFGKRPRINASRYLMVDGLLLRMVNSAAVCRVKLCHLESSCFQFHHSKDERSSIILANHKPNRNWLLYATESIQSVVRCQLSLFTKDKYRYLCSLRFKAKFGNFYLLNCSKHFQTLGKSVSLSDLESKIRNSRVYRDTSDRSMRPGMFQRDVDTSHSLIRVPLPTSTSSNNYKRLENKTRSSRSINSSYCPSVIPVQHDKDFESANKIYDTALKECGFIKVQKPSETYSWKLSIDVSRTFEVQILMDILGNIYKVLERPLVWVHATLIADRIMNSSKLSNDIRFKMETLDPVVPGSQLDQRLFPNSRGVKPLILSAFTTPQVIPHFKNDVLMLKQIHSRQFYRNGSVCAKISQGIDYSGVGLNLSRRVCELTFYFHEEELRSAIKEKHNIGEINGIVDNAINISLQVSNKIANMKIETDT